VAAGYSGCFANLCRGFGLAKYRANGGLDPSFDRDGRVMTMLPVDRSGSAADSVINALVAYPGGSVLAAGGTGDFFNESTGRNSLPRFALLKYLPSGRLDRRFGHDGLVTTGFRRKDGRNSEITAAARQRDGKVVVAGASQGCGDWVCFTVGRYLANGAVDRTFARRRHARNGFLHLNVPGLSDEANALAVLRRGRILITGGGDGQFVTVRLTRSGRRDRSFGGNGIVSTNLGKHSSSSRAAHDLLVDRRGITVAGGGPEGGGLIIRYGHSGQVLRNFGRRGRIRVPHLGIEAVLRHRCGLIVAGTTRLPSGDPSMALVGVPRGTRRPILRGMVTPFASTQASFGQALVRISRSRVVAVGRIEPSKRHGDFALAAYRARSLFPHC